MVVVPNLVGRSPEEAENMLQHAGLQFEFVEEKSTKAAFGLIFQQNPVPGTAVSPGSSVQLFIAISSPVIPKPILTLLVMVILIVLALMFTQFKKLKSETGAISIRPRKDIGKQQILHESLESNLEMRFRVKIDPGRQKTNLTATTSHEERVRS